MDSSQAVTANSGLKAQGLTVQKRVLGTVAVQGEAVAVPTAYYVVRHLQVNIADRRPKLNSVLPNPKSLHKS